MRGGSLAHNVAGRLTAGQPTLEAARWVEWSFCFARMADGPGTTLDFLSLGAAQRGHDVVALDRLPGTLRHHHERVTPLVADVLDRPLGARRFDQIVNCSSIEHVGLAGRYGSSERTDGDLEAMAILREALAESGRMILTIPVGRDAGIAPWHRVYGRQRLALLLAGYEVVEEQFWVNDADAWRAAPRLDAMDVQGTPDIYALGLFVLRAAG